MTTDELESLRGTDIYLLDQILKERYQPGESILDAGAGGGRNLAWFIQQGGYRLHACDLESEREALLRERYPEAKVDWASADLAELPYDDAIFRHVICNAVLHFARDEEHFKSMISELYRVMQAKASLFIRMCSDHGIAVAELKDGWYDIPDGSQRFLLTEGLLKWTMALGFDYLEPIKHVNVADQRVMSTLVLVKKA